MRWENRRDGRSGWVPAIKGYWRKGMDRADAPCLPMTPVVIDAHLRGEAHIGLCPLSDDDTCWWVMADFDKEAAMIDALAYMKAARSYGIPAAHWRYPKPAEARMPGSSSLMRCDHLTPST